MESKEKSKRKYYFIKKKFQTGFFIKFIILIFMEVVFAIAIFAFISRGTITTGYAGPELQVEGTLDFFLPTFSLFNLIAAILLGITGIIVFILVSHKIAGPLYRFEKSLKEISKGDLSLRCDLRKADQLVELADSLNQFTSSMDREMGQIKSNLSKTLTAFYDVKTTIASSQKDNSNLETVLNKLSEKLNTLKNSVDYFKISSNKNEKEI